MKLLLLVLVCVLATVVTQSCPRCTPLCQNGDGSPKTCGDDGCGGSCGSCQAGQSCCSGMCACVPNCNGRACGDDGCGYQSCGLCSSTQSCSNGQCVGTPTPDCSGKVCGSNRAGGSCGACGSGMRCRQGQCECYYDCNERNCGNAIQPSDTNAALCPQKSCGVCPNGFTCGSNGRCSAQTPCTVTLTVVDCATRQRVGGVSTVLISSSTYSYSSTVTITGGAAYSWNPPGLGAFTFQTSSDEYLVNTQTATLTATTTAVELCVNSANVMIDVRNIYTNVSIDVSATITYSGVCSGSLTWSGLATYSHCGYGTYFFVATPRSKYTTGNLTYAITVTTTLIIIYVQPLPIPITVNDCATNRALSSTASVSITTTSISSYSASFNVQAGGSASWSFPGYYTYSFRTSATGYLSNTQSVSVTTSTTSVTVCVSQATVQVDVRDRSTDRSITVGATVTYSGVISGSFRWNGITTFVHGGYGNYNFMAIPDSVYKNGTNSTSISASTTLIIIYVTQASFCGDHNCDADETYSTCDLDCVAIFFEFENADGSGPVNKPTVNYYLTNPRTPNSATGPNKNSAVATTSRTTGEGSNTVLDETYAYNKMVWAEAIATNFITFYWTVDTNKIDPALGIFRLRVHLSGLLTTNNFNYRFVNTWRPIDAEPAPYAPTDLNLHSFHPSGALDINHPNLTSNGFLIGRSVADSKQSGGPATMDISPSSGSMVAIWNGKPPRNSAIAPSQNNRYLIYSGSYVVFYGKTSNAATGKQVGEVVMDDVLKGQTVAQTNDLWYVAQFTPSQPGVDQPNINSQGKFKKSSVVSNVMYFDCEAYSYCNNFAVPYSDNGR